MSSISTTSMLNPWVASPGLTTRPYLMPPASRLHIHPAAMPARHAPKTDWNSAPSAGKRWLRSCFQRLVQRAAANPIGDRSDQFANSSGVITISVGPP